MLGFYGWYRFVLKNSIKSKSTFTSGDSFGTTPNRVFSWECINGLLATRPFTGSPFWFEHINEQAVPFDEGGNASFIEAQILGKVSLMDVEALYYPETDQFNQAFFQKLKKLENDFSIELKPY